jgi:hypothetical protein
MSRIRLITVTRVTLFVAILATASPSQAALIQLFSPADVSGETFIYPARPGPGLQPVVPSPFVLAGLSNVLTFMNETGSFIRMDEEPSVPSGGGWEGGPGFPNGTRLLYTGNNVGVGSGPISISFLYPILTFGLLAQHSQEGLGVFNFMVFNGLTLLGSLNMAADQPGFLGARVTDTDVITRIVISGSVLGDLNNFAIGPVTAQPIPEPAMVLLLGSGLLGLRVAQRRSKVSRRTRHD